MTVDRRKDLRSLFQAEHCTGTFMLEADDDEFEPIDVIDISLSGIGLELADYIEEGQEIVLIYEDDAISISVTGAVSWCDESPNENGNYNLGILFDYSYRDKNCKFYNALTAFIDSQAKATV